MFYRVMVTAVARVLPLVIAVLIVSMCVVASSAATDGPLQESPQTGQQATHRCEPISEIPLCSGLDYRHASFPNKRNHQNQAEANRELTQLNISAVLEVGCGGIVHLLCSIYAPICYVEFPSFVPPPPCKELCENTRKECEPTLAAVGLSWPTSDVLDCNMYISASTGGTDGQTHCISTGSITLIDHPEPPTNTPPGQVENFAVRAKGAHAMTFSWDPPIDSTTGEVSYTLSCVPQPEGFPHSFSDSPRRVTLQGFQPECEYGCSVAAISNGLTGPTVSKFATTPPSLGLQFVNDTPIVDNAVIRAEFKANRSVSRINCQLLGQHSTPKDCSTGHVSYASLKPGTYVLRVVAENSKQDRVVLRRKVKVPSAPNSCAVYHINGDISVRGRNATIQFVGTGPVEKFVCKCDSASREECSSPYSCLLFSRGDHHCLRVIPKGKGCHQKKYSYSIRF